MSTTTADTSFTAADTTTGDTATGGPTARQLRRSTHDQMLGGVASGVARYLNADVTVVRIITAALAVLTGAGVALYIAA